MQTLNKSEIQIDSYKNLKSDEKWETLGSAKGGEKVNVEYPLSTSERLINNSGASP